MVPWQVATGLTLVIAGAGYAVTTTMEVAAECGAEFEDPEDVPAVIESHRRPYGDCEPPPGPLYPVLD